VGRLGTRLARRERVRGDPDACSRSQRLHLGVAALQRASAGSPAARRPLCECACCRTGWETLRRRYEVTNGGRQEGRP